MKVSERLALNRQIARELCSRFTYYEGSEFLEAFGLKMIGSWDDDEEAFRHSISKASLDVVAEIIEDLGLSAFSDSVPIRQMPSMWANEKDVRVFVSHLSTEKDKATRLRDCLKLHGMSAFVAHEDIEPTLEWQVQIERALTNCELFISLHTTKFSSSIWTQQEIGYAVGRGIKIIAVRMGEDPKGFIQKNQALSRGVKTAEILSSEIKEVTLKDERLKQRFSLESVQDDLDDDIPF